MRSSLNTLAVVMEKPENVVLSRLTLAEPGPKDIVVDISWSGISTGTEKLLWSGNMPDFPGMGYPLVPGYEAVGTVVEAGAEAKCKVGDTVFVPGSQCYGEVRGLFGGSASRIVVSGERVLPVDSALQEQSILLALAATAYHALSVDHKTLPVTAENSKSDNTLIIGHGVLGRLLARLIVGLGHKAPTIWESNPCRMDADKASSQNDCKVCFAEDDTCQAYDTIYDASGDASLFDTLVSRLTPGGEIVLAGFYTDRISFAFPPAFMKEARFRIAAEWQPEDLMTLNKLLANEQLSLDGLITHKSRVASVQKAYRTAFEDPTCLKMILDWRVQ